MSITSRSPAARGASASEASIEGEFSGPCGISLLALHAEDTLTRDEVLRSRCSQLDQAVSQFEEVSQKLKANLVPDHLETSMNNLALAYRESGHIAKFVPLLQAKKWRAARTKVPNSKPVGSE